ncbi:MAG: ABC transporter permease subunit [Dehalococcoidia bacterium]|nr:ABC transporter permease subunit [Dehalococcoidia bacterium]
MAREAIEIAPSPISEESPVEQKAMSPTRLALRRLLKKKIAMIAIVFIIMFYVVGASAPLLSWVGVIPSYNDQNLDNTLQGPSWEHPFGTDFLGRDQLSRVVWASQTTVIITVASLITGGLILAVSLGLLSGYVGGWVDSAIMRVGDIFASLPSLLILILINATMKDQVRGLAADLESFTGIGGIVKSGAPDYFLIAITLSLFGWVGGARIIRSQILSLRETEFILAARAVGAPTSRILFRHLLPNVANIIIVSLSLGLAGIAGSEIVLTWFGIGIQPPHPSFGAMIFEASGVRTLNVHPHLLAFPAAVVVGLFFSFNLLGDALTDVFTPRAR